MTSDLFDGVKRDTKLNTTFSGLRIAPYILRSMGKRPWPLFAGGAWTCWHFEVLSSQNGPNRAGMLVPRRLHRTARILPRLVPSQG